MECLCNATVKNCEEKKKVFLVKTWSVSVIIALEIFATTELMEYACARYFASSFLGKSEATSPTVRRLQLAIRAIYHSLK